MDAVDVRILREMYWRPGWAGPASDGVKPWDIARRLGLHGNTVKTRLEEMRACGAYRGALMLPYPTAVDLQIAIYRFRLGARADRQAVLATMRKSGLVGDVEEFVGGDLWVSMQVHTAEDVAARVALLAQACGVDDVALIGKRHATKPPLRRLPPLDARIMKALLDDAHRPAADVATELGVTPRTVRNRLQALADDGHYMVVPHLSLGNFVGLGPALFALQLDDRDAFPELTQAVAAVDGVLSWSAFQPGGTGYVRCATPTVVACEDAFLATAELPGVAHADLLLCRDRHGWTEPMHAALERIATAA